MARLSASVSGEEVESLFTSGSPTADAAFQRWLRDPTKRVVRDVVRIHRTEFVLRLTPDAVERTCEETEHALGEVRRKDAEAIVAIRDWHPDFAFCHIFHAVVEENGSIPTWQELKAIRGQLDTMLWAPARKIIAETASLISSRSQSLEAYRQRCRNAMQWRIGNAYYSFLREMYVVSVLRSLGVDALVHPLADALFRTDLWVDRTLVSLYVGNSTYKHAGRGRKQSTEQMLGDARPPFALLDLELGVRREFGNVHLPSRAQISTLLDRL